MKTTSHIDDVISATPGEITNWMKTRKNKIDNLIQLLSKRIDGAPNGRVRLVPHNHVTQYYYVMEKDKPVGRYLRNDEIKLRNSLLQKAYDKKMLRAAQAEQKALDRFLGTYDPKIYEKIYTQSGAARMRDIKPVVVDEQEFVRQWEAYEYKKKPVSETVGEFYSEKGERMRSKSEVIIADMLYRMGVPYRYEQPMIINGITIHPDFTVLNVRRRKEIIWEHLGLLDESGYRNDAIHRMDNYEENGYFLGENLLISVETSKNPLNMKSIRRKIERYCL